MMHVSLLLPLLLLLLHTASVFGDRIPVNTYEINLDLPPAQRYLPLFDLSRGNVFNATMWDLYSRIGTDPGLQSVLYGIAAQRGPEIEEMQQELEGFAAASALPVQFVQAIQMLFEIQTLMVPIVNFTGTGYPAFEDYPEGSFPEGYEALARIPWRGPGKK